MAKIKKQIEQSQDYNIDVQSLSSILDSVLNKEFSKTHGQVSYDVSGNSLIDPTTIKN